MKVFFAIILMLTIPQALGAWGVSERSVKKWDAEKLCTKSAELEIKKDWKAVAIIAKEIAARADINIDACADLSKQREKEIKNERREARTGPVSDDVSKILGEARISGLEKFGADVYKNVVRASCKKEKFDSNLRNDYQDHVAAVLPIGYQRYAHINTNAVDNEARGFALALNFATTLGPDLCSDAGIKDLERLIDAYVAAMTQPATNQNVDFITEIGQEKKEVLKKIGEPILVEDIGVISAEHYCRTLDSGNGGDEFLVLYFLSDSLLYSHRYKGPDALGDCAEFAGQGEYEIPDAIKSIVGSRIE